MKLHVLLPALVVATLVFRASAAVATLNSPDGRWRISSDEFGAYGAGLPGAGAFRDFGAGLNDYSFAASLMITDGITRQPLTSHLGAGWGSAGAPGQTVANVLSDTVTANTRTSSYTVTGFPALRVDLTQTAANSGISQQYVLSNTGATPLNLTAVTFHDVDLDGATWLSNILTSAGGGLGISDGGSRVLYFSPAAAGFQGFMAGFVPPGGITGALDTHAWDNFGIPAANMNQFREFIWPAGGGPAVIGGNFDGNADGISDGPADVGFLFQNALSIPAGGSVTLALGTVPEPSTALLGLLPLGLMARRRRQGC